MIAKLYTSLVAKRDELNKDDKGFTLIELLVVVLIIGILAAIAIPIFIAQQEQAKDSGARTDAANLKTAVVSWKVENPSGTLPTAGADYDEFSMSGNTTAAIVQAGSDGAFCVQTTSSTTKTFAADNKTGVIEGTCVGGVATAAAGGDD